MKVQKVVEVCDTCEDLKKPVEKYTISKNGGKAEERVLCSQHSRPIEVLLGNAKPTGRPPSRKPRVKTLAQIEAEKKPK